MPVIQDDDPDPLEQVQPPHNSYLLPPERRQSLSRESMLSDILNAYSDTRRSSRLDDNSSILPNGYNQLPVRKSPGTLEETGGLASHNSDTREQFKASQSGSGTPTVPSPTDSGVGEAEDPRMVDTEESLTQSTSYAARRGDTSDDVDSATRRKQASKPLSGMTKRHSLKKKPELDGLRRLSGEHASIDVATAERSERPPRNVIVRRTRKPDASKSQDQGRHLDVDKNIQHNRVHSAPNPKFNKTDMSTTGSSRSTSAVVHATVVFPEQRTHRLRHVSKAESLRSNASRQSNRNSLVSEATSASPVHTYSDKRKRLSTDTNASVTSHSPSLRRKADFDSIRPSPTVDGSLRRPSSDRNDSGHSPAIPDSWSNGRRAAQSQNSVRTYRTAVQDSNGSSRSEKDSPEIFHDAASQFHRPSYESLQIVPTHQSYYTPKTPDQWSSPFLGDHRRVSFDPTFVSTGSTDRYARFSPVSTRSEATEAFEVREAAAVGIYPHTNQSLLMVHHRNSGDVLRPNGASSRAMPEQDGAGLGVLNAGPMEAGRTESPLSNPRSAPLPPRQDFYAAALAITPPTPAKDIEAQRDDLAPPPRRPQRGNSVLQRARRYSDTVIQPITGSLRRKRQARANARSSSARPRPGPNEEGENLHPFWKPRRFWNDLSDDEDESGRNTDTRGESSGNSTEQLSGSGGSQGSSNEHDIEPSMSSWRRGGSRRGFLLGNTLGLERGGTNRWKPRITLPSQRGRESPQQPPPSSYKPPSTSVRDSARRSGISERSSANRKPGHHRRSSSLTRLWQSWQDRRSTKEQDAEEEAANIRRDQLRTNIRHVGPSEGGQQEEDSTRFGRLRSLPGEKQLRAVGAYQPTNFDLDTHEI